VPLKKTPEGSSKGRTGSYELRINDLKGWGGKPRRRVGVQSGGMAPPRKINMLASDDEFRMNSWRTSENYVPAKFAECTY
jgi:hypothetical protein